MVGLCTLEKAMDWFYDLGEEPITVFADVLRIFLKCWDSHYYEEEEYEKIIEDIIVAMPKKEEASIASPIENQALEEHNDEEHIEDQSQEEDPNGENNQASILEDQGLESLNSKKFHDHFQPCIWYI